MKKEDLERNICEKGDFTQKDVKKFIKIFTEIIKENVAAGEKVQLIGFGSFESRKRNARTGRNPQNGKAIKIPASVVPAFKAGKAFKDTVNTAHEAEKSAKRGKKK